MWMEIADKLTFYLVNVDSYQCIRMGKDCMDEPTIIFYDTNGNDLILIYTTEEQRDETYQKIISFMTVTKIRY